MHIHGGDIYREGVRLDFSANLNFLGMPASVAEAACQGVYLSDHYPDVRCEKLRQALSQKEGVPAESIICGNGAADLIFGLALSERPVQAVICAPTFHEYEQALNTVGTRIRRVWLKEEEQFAYSEEILEALTEDVDLLVMCNPNNPTGKTLEPELLKKILDRCRENQIRFLLDECFVDFLDEPEYYTAAPFLSEYPELVILKAFTKIYAMAGLRLGYALMTDQELIRRMKEVRQPWSVSIPAQMAGVAALKETEYVERYRSLLKIERQRLREALEAMGAKLYDSKANYIFFRARMGLEEELRSQGILIRDCSNYEGLGPGFYRMAVRSQEENLQMLEVLSTMGNLSPEEA